MLFQQIRRSVQHDAPRGRRGLPDARQIQRGIDIGQRRKADIAGAVIRARRVLHGKGRSPHGIARQHRSRQHRPRLPAMRGKARTACVKRRQGRPMRQIPAPRIAPLRLEKLGPGGDVGRKVGQCLERIAGDGLGRDLFIDDLVDKGRIRAVLQQPAHQIGQQIAVRADGGVDAAAGVFAVLDDLVQGRAHAVQSLEFISRPAPHIGGHIEDGGDGMGIMRGELRIDAVGLVQQMPRVG